MSDLWTEIDICIDAGVREVTLTPNLWEELIATVDYGDAWKHKYRMIRYLGLYCIAIHHQKDAGRRRPLLTVNEPIEMR